jgi:ribonuclease P protein component
MLPKKRRLNRKTFAENFSQGFFVSSPLFSLRISSPKTLIASRFSVVVAQKVTKNKPERNHIKRQLYSLIGEFLPQTAKPVVGIFFVKKEALKIPFSALRNEVKAVLTGVKLLK